MSLYEKQLMGLEDHIGQKMKEWKVPGTAVVIVKDGETAFLEGFGKRNVKEDLDVTPDTVFPIASSTKPFTALAAGILADEGKLRWDEPVIKYMSWFKMYDSFATEHVTLRDMLCHRTGLSRHDLMWINSPFSRREIVERTKYLQPDKEFRKVWQYQNHMYTAVSCLIEEITGITWEEFVRQRIFMPLGMDNSSFSVGGLENAANCALPYKLEKGKFVEKPRRNLDAMGGCGAINSNIRDMAKWLSLMLDKGIYQGRRIVSEAVLQEMYTPQIEYKLFPFGFKEIKNCGYGLGCFVDEYEGRRIISHGGNIEGITALVSLMPEENLGMAILSNKGSNFMTYPLSYEVYDRFLGTARKDWSGAWIKELKYVKTKQAKKLMSRLTLPSKLSAVLLPSKRNEILVSSYLPKKKPGADYSHPPENYTGVYRNAGYGELVISKEGKRLKAVYNKLEAYLKHYHCDTFILKFKPGDAMPMGFMNFHTDLEGGVGSVSLPLDPDLTLKEICFEKKR